MKSQLQFWWKKIKEHPISSIVILIAIISLIALIVVIILGYCFNWDWTGLGPYTPPNSNFQRGKTLWDWFNLLGVLGIPLAVGFGTVWFTKQQAKESAIQNEDNQREAAMQDYIDKMSELLLNGNLAEKKEDGQPNPEYKRACLVARVRTITVLTRLDARRISHVFAFLREAELMSATKDDNAISLNNADLHAVDWSQADLRGADLRGANLSGANLSRAIFFNTIYVPRAFGSTIIMSGNCANLGGVDLSGANLSGAKATEEQLKQAKSLKGATMPDGTIHL